MAFTPTELAIEIRDLEGIAKGLKHYISVVQTTQTDDNFYARSRKKIWDDLQRTQKALDELDRQRNDGDAIIARTYEQIDNVTARLNLLKHQRQIQKLMQLKADIEAMQELDPAAAQAMLEKNELLKMSAEDVERARVHAEMEAELEDEDLRDDAPEPFEPAGAQEE